MRIILEEVDGCIYGDIIISPKEMQAMKYGEMADGLGIYEYRRYYIGVRLQGAFDEIEDDIEKENEKDDA